MTIGAVPKVVIVCPFYFVSDPQRAEVTRRVFRNLADMPHAVIGVGSEGALSRRLFYDEFGSADKYHEYAQDFDCFAEPIPGAGCEGLRRKFDFAVQAAKTYDPEYVFCTGSDDLVPWEFFRGPFTGDLVGIGESGHEGAATNLWRVGTQGYAHVTSSGFEWRGARLLGGPLGFSRAYLDDIEWRPFSLPNCEVGAELKARGEGRPVEARPVTFWQVKTGEVLNPIRDFAHRWQWRDGIDDGEYDAFRKRWAELG